MQLSGDVFAQLILKKTHILKPDNVVGVGSAGDSAVQINIAPLPEIGFPNGQLTINGGI